VIHKGGLDAAYDVDPSGEIAHLCRLPVKAGEVATKQIQIVAYALQEGVEASRAKRSEVELPAWQVAERDRGASG
jgi:hypothetical protein